MHLLEFVGAGLADVFSPRALQWTIWGLLMSLIMGWMARSRMRSRAAASTFRLNHSLSTLIIGLVGFGFFSAIAVLSNVYANKTTTWATTATFVGFALLALPIIGDYFAARHEVSEDGLRYSRLVGSGGYVPWSDLKSVELVPA